MSSGQSVESFVGLATGRPQSSCQVGNGRREREGFHRVCLRNLNWILLLFLKRLREIDINVKLLLATELCSFIRDAVQKIGHMGPQFILRLCMHVFESEDV